MRPSFPTLPVAALAAALIQAPAAGAQTIPSPFTFIEATQETGLFVGHMSAATGRFGYGPSGGTLFGARYGVGLSGPLSFEGAWGLVSGTRDVINPGRAEGARVVGVGDVLLTTIDARLRFSLTGERAWHGLSPFLAVGIGMVFDLEGSAEADSDLEAEDVFDFGSSLFTTISVGTRLFVSERFTLRTDGVFSIWKIETPPGFSNPLRGFRAVEESEWVRGLSIVVSVLLRW